MTRALLASVLDAARSSDSLAVAVVVMAAGALVGYAIGAINPASIIARLRGTDLRSIGSGNPGATNAGRAFGWKVGVLVGLLDVLKGFVPVQLLQWLGFHDAALVSGLAAVVGHITSPYLRGRGGKGVATSFGAVLAVQPLWALPVLAVFGIAFALTRRIGLASVAGCLALVPTALLLHSPLPDVLFAAALTVLVVVRHRRNLQAALSR
ncbi:MAG: glycerol-3-phosphate 1-O-acyltransferase PlsY [Actinobacteria bacterium]|nr:glycerol-3-phosphate 1-O-acyltransferase PlsY [Actinomycetota bacterium]